MSNTYSFQTYQHLNNVVVALHKKLYRGKNKASRYNLGNSVIAVVEDDQLAKIIDFSKQRTITPDRTKGVVMVQLLKNESSLAEDVRDKLTDAIKAVTTDHIIKAFEAAKMLPDRWLSTKLDLIYKYSSRCVNPEI